MLGTRAQKSAAAVAPSAVQAATRKMAVPNAPVEKKADVVLC